LRTEELDPPAEGRVHLWTSNQGRSVISQNVRTLFLNLSLPISREKEFCSGSPSCIVELQHAGSDFADTPHGIT